jgi:rare lipoprotein A (peptidoglycan hydrolase)
VKRAALSIALALAPAVGAQHHRRCQEHYTIADYEHWIVGHQHGGEIPRSAKPRMWTMERCQAHGQPARLAGIRWRIHYLRSITYALAHPLLHAVASWYSDASGACASPAGCSTYGVANRSLEFGTRVQFVYHGREAVAVVDDRGPYAGDRTWDLNQNTAGALGFSGVDVVAYRVLP